MSQRSNDAETEEQRGDAKGQTDVEERALINHAPSNLSESISDAAVHLHGLMLTKEKELKEREADFDRRVRLFEAENPTLGRDNDVIQLNVGGSANIAVLRRTLTQFEDSMLAAKFSGRWDDALERDRDGNFFVDQDPENFLRLIAYLRLRNNRPKAAVRPPAARYQFCSMLEYYGLMSCIYARNWISNSDKMFDWEDKHHGSIAMFTEEAQDDAGSVTVIHEFGRFASTGVTEFTVEFEKGTTGAVGWLDLHQDCGRSTNYKIPCSLSASSISSNSIFLSITDRKIFGLGGVLEENIRINHMESRTKVICKSTGAKKNGDYSIEVVDSSPPGGVVATLQKSPGSNRRVFPMVSFCGKVAVSGLKYDIDQFP